MPSPRFHGVIVPFITPFREDLSVDYEAARWLADYQVSRGAHGVFPNSTTGEFVHLETEEAVQLTRVVLEAVGGRAWVIPGITANCTEHAVELGRVFKDMGVSGVVVAPPFYFKYPANKLRKHFTTIAERVDLPIIVYNVPELAGVNIPVELYVELAREFSNIVAAKVTYDSVAYLRKLIAEVKAVRRDFAVLTGYDEMFLTTLVLGGDGGVVALANVAPQVHRSIYDAWASGDLGKAYTEFKRLLTLVKLFDAASTRITAIKTALKVLGTPVKPYVRPPLTPEPPEVEKKVRDILEEADLNLQIR